MRFHVHFIVRDMDSGDEIATATFTVDALDDDAAQRQVFALLPDLSFDITEIEPA